MFNRTLSDHRKISLTTGLLYLLTFVSIPTLTLYANVRKPDFILGSGSDTGAIIGVLLEVLVAFACAATAVVIFPIIKKQNEALARGFLVSRVIEAGAILIGTAVIMTVVSMHQQGVTSDSLPLAQWFIALYDRIFLQSQSFLPAINDLILGVLLYKSKLIPKSISLIGIIGSIPLFAAYLLVMFGSIEQKGSLAGAGALLVALFELLLGLWLTFNGFNQKSVAALEK